MTVSRALYAIFLLVGLGLAVVAARGESAKAANRVQRLHQQQVALQQQLWSGQMELARLRAPNEIRRRASELGLDLIPPRVSERETGAKDRPPAD